MRKVRGKNEIEAALRRLDRLTLDEGRAATAQTLEDVYNFKRVVLDGEKAPHLLFFFFCLRLNIHTLRRRRK